MHLTMHDKPPMPKSRGLLPPLPSTLGAVTVPALSVFHDQRDDPTAFERIVLQLTRDGFHSQDADELIAALTLAPPFRECFNSEGPAVLVFDEAANLLSPDERVALNAAFDMALTSHPEKQVIVLAPVEGEKSGWLLGYEGVALRGITPLPALTDLAELAPHLDAAYTHADERAWPLFLADVPIFCTGMPLYAGWGHTTDVTTRDARTDQAVSKSALVEAAFLRLSSYRNPYTGIPIPALEALEIRQDMARMLRITRRIAAYDRFPRWRHDIIRQMFAGCDAMHCSSFEASLARAKAGHGAVVAWSSKVDAAMSTKADAMDVPLFRMEDGFVRSVGLGAAGFQPLSLVLDDRGIYYDCRSPSRLETMLNNAHFDDRLLARARSLITSLRALRISKYNLGERTALPSLPTDRRIILVPGQVEDDASILYGADGMSSIAHLREVRAQNPDAFILFKPHPDVSSGLRKGLADPLEAERYADIFIADVPILDLIDTVDEVHTLTSLTGFEALLRGKLVVCYGQPFYAGWGLTRDHKPIARRIRSLMLEELVAATLILYPHYLDPITGLPGSPEIAIARILEYRLKPVAANPLLKARGVMLGLWSRLRKLRKGLK